VNDAAWRVRVREMHRSVQHQHRCYELNGTRTASVRDQMVRATALVAALSHPVDGELRAGAVLLVIGAGAAGVSAAMAAVELGRRCVLIDAPQSPDAPLEGDSWHAFRRQFGVTTRWLDPTEYDWPQSHWAKAAWPAAGYEDLPASPLPYAPAAASALARQWFAHFQAWRTGLAPGVLELLPDTRDADLDLAFGPSQVDVLCKPSKWPSGVGALGAVISCVGQGTERLTAADESAYQGLAFWASDPWSDRGLGLGVGAGRPARVLVSGGGDGAMQDIQRALCGDFGRRLLDRHWNGRPLSDALMTPAHTAAVAATEAAWVAEQRQGIPMGAAWVARDRACVDVAHDFWNAVSEAQRSAIARLLLRREALTGSVHLTWLLRGERATACYALNRMLVELVLLAYVHFASGPLRQRRDLSGPPIAGGGASIQPVVVPGYQMAELESAATQHACGAEKSPCHRWPHHVSVSPSGGGRAQRLGTYDIVIVRHGVAGAPAFGGARQPIQTLPSGWLD
jgi:hypothetical protein